MEHRRKRGSDELENSEKETETAKRSIIFFAEIQRTLEKSISVSKHAKKMVKLIEFRVLNDEAAIYYCKEKKLSGRSMEFTFYLILLPRA